MLGTLHNGGVFGWVGGTWFWKDLTFDVCLSRYIDGIMNSKCDQGCLS